MKWTGRYKGYAFASFRKDLISGLTVGIIAIPLGMAFAIASGVKPEYGIYTTIVAGICISLFGGSRFQIGGPTGAFVPILLAIVLQYGYENLLIAGFLAGLMLIAMGLLRLGALIEYIPRPVTIGFTSGIAVIIFTGQLANFLGLDHIEKHEEFIPNMLEIGNHLSSTNGFSLLTAGICLAIILAFRRFAPRVPGSLVGLVASALFAAITLDGRVATIGSMYGGFPDGMPGFRLPAWSLGDFAPMVRPAFVIAMLGAIESLLSAVVADKMTGTRHDSNRELIGQGISNAILPFFGGIPATGAIARTATNIRSGAVSPISGVIHGIVALSVLLAFAPYAEKIPLASMAPILMVVAWNMNERAEFLHVLKSKSTDSIVLVATFALTVFADLILAVEVGLLLAVLLFAKRMSDLINVKKVLPDRIRHNGKVKAHMITEGHDCPQFSIYSIDGPLFFGISDAFEKLVDEAAVSRPKFVLLRMDNVPFMDMSGEAKLASAVRRLQILGIGVLVSGLSEQPAAVLRASGLYETIGRDRFFERTAHAIAEAMNGMEASRCIACRRHAFQECERLWMEGNGSTAGAFGALGLQAFEKKAQT